MTQNELSDPEIFPEGLEVFLPKLNMDENATVEWEGRIAAIRREVKIVREVLEARLDAQSAIMNAQSAILNANHKDIMERLNR